jgi:type II secretory pathway pseudopilin PulG
VNPHKKAGGFTIAELAIATAILALLLFSAMVPFSSQMDIRNISETRRTMDTAKDAILGFAQANGRLPCPADGSIGDGVPGAGMELFSANSCTSAVGVVPWATLGTPETDSWGHRFTYRVSPAFADSPTLTTWNTLASAYTPPAPPPIALTQAVSSPPSPGNQAPSCDLYVTLTSSSFALCSLGDMVVFTRSGSQAVPLGTALPAVFVSHGKNGYGAWQSNGIRLSAPAAGTDEAANVNGGTPSVAASVINVPNPYPSYAFYSHPPTPASSGCSDPAPVGTSSSPLCEFDDIVVMISSNVLIARMVAAGKLP